MKPGEGPWKAASEGPTTFKTYVPDPVAWQVGFLCVLKDGDKPIQLGLRLKLKGGRIMEVEHLIARDLRESLRNLQMPRPGLLTTVPLSERLACQKMLKIGESYCTAIGDSTGKAAPFADDCENGMQTTGNPPPDKPGLGTIGAMGCRDGINTDALSYITRIEPGRVEIADPETGLVFGLPQFRRRRNRSPRVHNAVQLQDRVGEIEN
jgi:hypothetical protein